MLTNVVGFYGLRLECLRQRSPSPLLCTTHMCISSASSFGFSVCPPLFRSGRILASVCTRWLRDQNSVVSDSTVSTDCTFGLGRESRWPQVGFSIAKCDVMVAAASGTLPQEGCILGTYFCSSSSADLCSRSLHIVRAPSWRLPLASVETV